MTIDGERVLTTVKRYLRKRGITYADLADELEMSESGVKKMLNASDISFNKLARIAQHLGVEAEVLITEARTGNELHIHLSDETQRYLISNPDVAIVFWLLYFEGRAVDELVAIIGIDEHRVFKCLAALDRLGLVTLMPGNRVVLLTNHTHITWEDKGPFIAALTEQWSAELVTHLIANPGPSSFLSLRYLRLTRASLEALRAELHKLDGNFTTIARSEMAVHAWNKLEPVSWLTAMERRPLVSDFRRPLLRDEALIRRGRS